MLKETKKNGLSRELRAAIAQGHFYAYAAGVAQSQRHQLRIARHWLSLAKMITVVFPQDAHHTQTFADPAKIPDAVVSGKMRRAIFAYVEAPSLDELTEGFTRLFDPGFIKNPRTMFRNSVAQFARTTRYAATHPEDICVAFTETNGMEILAFWAGRERVDAVFAAARNAKITARGKITSCFAHEAK